MADNEEPVYRKPSDKSKSQREASPDKTNAQKQVSSNKGKPEKRETIKVSDFRDVTKIKDGR